jgi:hypothetical protein
MFDILADAEALPRETELLLDSLEGGDNPLWVVGTVEVPGIKAREVLEGTEELVAADYRRGGGVSWGRWEAGGGTGTYWLLRRSGGNGLPLGGRRGHRRPSWRMVLG